MCALQILQQRVGNEPLAWILGSMLLIISKILCLQWCQRAMTDWFSSCMNSAESRVWVCRRQDYQAPCFLTIYFSDHHTCTTAAVIAFCVSTQGQRACHLFLKCKFDLTAMSPMKWLGGHIVSNAIRQHVASLHLIMPQEKWSFGCLWQAADTDVWHVGDYQVRIAWRLFRMFSTSGIIAGSCQQVPNVQRVCSTYVWRRPP